MLVKVKRNQKVSLPDNICQELGISTGDRLDASIQRGRIVLQPVDQILMFGAASEAFDNEDFD